MAILYLLDGETERALALGWSATSAPGRVLEAQLAGQIRQRSRRWGQTHRLARLFDLYLDAAEPSLGDSALLAALGRGDKLGLSVETLDERTRMQLRVRGGIIVSEVHPESPAAATGLQAGDVIVRIGNIRVTNSEIYHQLLEQLPEGRPIAIRFFRNGRPGFRTIVVE